MSRDSQPFSFARTDHPFWERLIAFGTWTWHVIGWIWSTVIIGGLLVSLLLTYATTGSLMDLHSWVIIRFLLAHPLVTVLVLLLALLLSFGAYLADRSHRHTQRQHEHAYQQALVTIGEGVHHLLEEVQKQPRPPVIHTLDQRVRVFVSSTLDELAPERQAAREAIAQLHSTPVFFESGAGPYPPRELYRVDLFVGIYWQHYGQVVPPKEISDLEEEYRLWNDKPRLIYVKTPAPQREPRLQALLDRIRAENVASYQKFTTPDELRDLIADDLDQVLTDRFTQAHEAPHSDQVAPLPVPRSPLIDREREVEAIRIALMSEEVGMVTLTGTGGVGKTRLAVQVAAEVAPRFADGVAFVSLAALKEPALLLPTIAHALRVSEESSSAVGESLVEYLRPRHLLLVLDNIEQLVSTAPLATRTLELAPHLKLLITSREPLRVRDEHTIPISPLALPDPTHLPDLATLAQIPSVALFVQRAREAKPDFALTEENARAVAEICLYLDGLPLALELAAARSSILPPELLLARLAHRLPLLTRGARDLPERQQTLRNTIAWSYDLLNAREQELFRRVAVFVGGFTLEAAAAMETGSAGASRASTEQDDEELDAVESLVSKNLLRVEQGVEGEPRFATLATIREYALEQLEAHGEKAAAQQQHANFYLHRAEEIEPYLYRAGRSRWLEHLEREDNNLRVALAWCKNDRNTVQTGLRLAGALSRYWFMLGNFCEGRSWLEGMLERTGNADRSTARGKALCGAGELAYIEGNYDVASSHAEESLSIWREVGDTWGISYAEKVLGLVRMGQGRIAEARSLFEESHTLFKNMGHAWGQAIMLFFLGTADELSGDLATARARYEESLHLFRQHGDAMYSLLMLSILAGLVSSQGDEETARSLYDQILPLLHRPRSRWELGMFLITNGDYRLHLFGHDQQAKVLYKEGLSLWQDIQRVGDGIGIVKALSGLAEVAAAEGQAEQAGWLFGSADTLLPAHSNYRDNLNDHVSRARTHLDTAKFATGWAAGQKMTKEQAITRTLQEI